jgi:hypothetical protein
MGNGERTSKQPKSVKKAGGNLKNPKKPTVAQRKLMQKWGLRSADWFVTKDTPEQMVLVHRHSDKTTKIIPKC